MVYNTRKHTAKVKREKAAKAREAAMFARATKTIRPSLEYNPDSPRASVEALENYLARLEIMRDDLQAEFSDLPEFASASRWLSTEIRIALEALVKLRIRIEAGP